MRTFHSVIAFLAATGGVQANLHNLAQAAGLTYFGTATDNGELTDVPYVNKLSDSSLWGQITPGNGQKWQFIEPSQNSFDYAKGDEIADLAARNGQMLRCHTLVWHSQLPNWVSSGSWTISSLTSVIQNHIANEVGHYKGQCYAWDVVNEALNSDGSIRSSVFSNVFGGAGFIPVAFAAARAADPAAKLYYNDYSIGWAGAKANGVLALIDTIRDAGAPIDGIGEQAHYTVGGGTPSQSMLESVARAYLAKDVEFALTELDIRFSSLPATSSGLQTQADNYASVVRACLNVEGCVGITVWDFTDKYSWIPNTFEGEGAACLFDEDLNAKPAYYSVQSVLASAASTIISTMTSTSTAAATTTAVGEAAARWEQCGGLNHNGPTHCASPWTCTYVNEWYSQCL